MDHRVLSSPTALLRNLQGDIAHAAVLTEYETWWEREGKDISAAHDGGHTLAENVRCIRQAHGRSAVRAQIWTMLRKGYTTGVIWRAMKEGSLKSSFRIGYISSSTMPTFSRTLFHYQPCCRYPSTARTK